MKNRTYDIIQIAVTVGIPAAATLVGTLGNIWGLSNAEKVALTLTGVGAFGSAVVKGISVYYHKNN